MRKQQLITRYIGLLLFLFVYFVSPRAVSAVACTGLPSIGDLSLSSCILTIAGTTGSDQAGNTEGSTANTANLLLSTGASVTINATGILAVGSISPQGGSISIDDGGQIKLNTPLYIPDADADGWALNFSTVSTATAPGTRRLSLMRSAATTDCGDSTYATNNVCCTVATRYQDADGDGYGNPSVSISACTTAGYVDNNTDANDSQACASGANPAGSCNKCVSGAIANQISAEDVFSECAGPSLNACSGNTPIGPNGLCNGSGACDTTSNTGSACATAGACQAGGGCSAGSCVSVYADNNSNPTYPLHTYYDGGQVCTGNACQQGRRWYSANSCTAGSPLGWAETSTNNGCSPSWTYYRDADGDGYGSAGNGTTTCCSGTCPGGYVSNNSDCYDSNASAYPGSGVCSTGSRGDGSFDWNCSGGASACGTTFYSTVDYGAGYCVDYNTCGGTEYNPRCCVCGTITYIGGGVGCGGGGYSAGTYGAADQCGCGGCRMWGYFPGYYGTQACQ